MQRFRGLNDFIVSSELSSFGAAFNEIARSLLPVASCGALSPTRRNRYDLNAFRAIQAEASAPKAFIVASSLEKQRSVKREGFM